MNRIPKKIHYCWFGPKEKPELVQKCIASWKQYAPDYELVEWNEWNFDVSVNAYAREALKAEKYAFVSDYARFQILFEHGGIYLDTDVELYKSLDSFLENEIFMGYDRHGNIAPGLILGSVPGNIWLKRILKEYSDLSFRLPNGRPDLTTVVTRISSLLEQYQVPLNGELSEQDGLVLYPCDYFDPKDFETGHLFLTENTVSVHHYAASWKSDTDWKIYRLGKVLKAVIGDKAYARLAHIKHKIYG